MFFSFIMLITVICKLCIQQMSCRDAYGTVWAFILTAGFLLATANGAILLVSYKDQESTREGEYEEVMLKIMTPIIGYFLVTFMMTILAL